MKGKRKNHFFLILIISVVVILIYRIILAHFIGSKGVAYFSVPNEIYFGLVFSLSYAFEQGVGVLIESRMKRSMYENAQKVFKAAILLSSFIGVLMAVLVWAFSSKIAEGLFAQPLSLMALLLLIPSIPFGIVTGVLRGYFNSTENSGMTDQSYIVFSVIYVAFGLIFSSVFIKRGVKISAIIRIEDFQYAYGAAGAALGLLTASVVTFLHALGVFFLYKSRTVIRDTRDYSRQTETVPKSIVSILINSAFPFIIMASFFVTTLINEIFIMKNSADDELIVFNYGEYYGKTFPLITSVMMILCIFVYSFIRKALGAAQKEEYGNARNKLGKMIHRCVTVGLFFTGMVLILADNILDTIFTTNGSNTVKYLQVEAVSIVLGLFSIIFIETLINLKYGNLVAIMCAIAMVIHIVLNIVLISGGHLSIIGAIISNLIFYLLLAVSGFLFVTRTFSYTQEWFRTFGVSIIGAGISSLIGLLLNKAFSPLMGKLISMVVVFAICLVIYIIILLLLKGYSEEELDSSAPGRVIASIGRAFRLL